MSTQVLHPRADVAGSRGSLRALVDEERRRTRARRLEVILALLVLPVVAALAYYQLRPSPPPSSALFRTVTVTRGDVVREVRATGRAEAVTTVQVGAEVSGKLLSVDVDFNAPVKAGQVLARFDQAAFGSQLRERAASLAGARASVVQARTERDRAELDRARAERLFEARVTPPAERDAAVAMARAAEARVSGAEAQVAAEAAAFELARTNLDHTTIVAPIDGVVITRNVDPGQTVASTLQTPILFTVAADLRRMRVLANVDEADIGEVATGQRASFTVNAFPGRIFDGVVSAVRSSPQVVQDVVTYAAEITVQNTDLALRPGMTASVRIETGRAANAERIPDLALRFTPPGETPRPSTVWTLDREAVRPVAVVAGLGDGEVIAIGDGALAVGAAVITELSTQGKKAHGPRH